MNDFYNDFDGSAVEWLGRLVRTGRVPAGKIDDRDLREITPEDVAGYRRCHFFAGIGGWARALELSGWPEDLSVWTGSCPCQPYSSAGKRMGDDDPRNMWPTWRNLIAKCRPPRIVGEQTASADGRRWLAGVRADLEALGYAVGAADLCAAGVSAPHLRQRLYWVADADGKRFSRGPEQDCQAFGPQQQAPRRPNPRGRRVGMEYAPGERTLFTRAAKQEGNGAHYGVPVKAGPWDQYTLVRCPSDGRLRRLEPGIEPVVDGFPGRVALIRGYGNAIVTPLAAEFLMAYLEARECVLDAS